MKQKKQDTGTVILTISMGFLVVYFIFKLKWILLTSLIVGLVGIFSPFLSKQIVFIWTKLSSILALIVPNILLIVLFYLFIFPISVLKKVFTKEKIVSQNSNFMNVSKSFEAADLEHPW